MNLSAVDLNLLVVLDALLVERSVSRAAKHLHSTQPAVSRALGRLRTLFDDPLLTRTRQGMVPTARALAMASEVRSVLDRVHGLISHREAFEPRSSRRVFRMTMSDYPLYLVCSSLLARLGRIAPGVDLEVLPWSLEFPTALESGAIDAVVCPPTTPVPGLHSREMLTDGWVALVRRGHPAAKGLALKDYAALTHLQSAPNGRAGSLIDDLLEREGFSRRIVLRAPSLLSLPPLVAGSNHCATVPGRLAAAFADVWGLVAVPLPFEVPRLALNLVWHTRADHDAGHTWLRDEILGLFAGRATAPSRGPVGVIDLSRRSRQTL